MINVISVYEKANLFYESYHGKHFSSLAPFICNLAYVESVSQEKTSKGGFLSKEFQTELPSCPICLERIDETIDGVLTVLCNHSYHTACITNMKDNKCSICRHFQSPPPDVGLKCIDCEFTDKLWLCLICGNVACGRYQNEHAYTHFQLTSHTFALQVGGTEVWDYAGDHYVHRLIETSEGKPVEWWTLEDREKDKIESIVLEYTHLLTHQIESQKNFYENRINEIEAQHKITKLSKLPSSNDNGKNVFSLEKKIKTFQQKNVQLTQKNSQLMNELKEEQLLNSLLTQNNEKLNEKIEIQTLDYKNREEHLKEKIKALQEEINDLMAHLDFENKMKSLNIDEQEEIKQGKIQLSEKKTTK